MIAAVNGVVAGMACSFVLACDFASRPKRRASRSASSRSASSPTAAARSCCRAASASPTPQRLCLTAEPVAARRGAAAGAGQRGRARRRAAARARGPSPRAIAAQPPHAVAPDARPARARRGRRLPPGHSKPRRSAAGHRSAKPPITRRRCGRSSRSAPPAASPASERHGDAGRVPRRRTAREPEREAVAYAPSDRVTARLTRARAARREPRPRTSA